MNELEKIKVIPLYGQTNIQTVICLASEWLAGPYCLGAATELAELKARIETLETAAGKAVEWLHHYPSPEGIAEQTEANLRRASRILEEALKGEQ